MGARMGEYCVFEGAVGISFVISVRFLSSILANKLIRSKKLV